MSKTISHAENLEKDYLVILNKEILQDVEAILGKVTKKKCIFKKI